MLFRRMDPPIAAEELRPIGKHAFQPAGQDSVSACLEATRLHKHKKKKILFGLAMYVASEEGSRLVHVKGLWVLENEVNGVLTNVTKLGKGKVKFDLFLPLQNALTTQQMESVLELAQRGKAVMWGNATVEMATSKVVMQSIEGKPIWNLDAGQHETVFDRGVGVRMEAGSGFPEGVLWARCDGNCVLEESWEAKVEVKEGGGGGANKCREKDAGRAAVVKVTREKDARYLVFGSFMVRWRRYCLGRSRMRLGVSMWENTYATKGVRAWREFAECGRAVRAWARRAASRAKVCMVSASRAARTRGGERGVAALSRARGLAVLVAWRTRVVLRALRDSQRSDRKAREGLRRLEGGMTRAWGLAARVASKVWWKMKQEPVPGLLDEDSGDEV